MDNWIYLGDSTPMSIDTSTLFLGLLLAFMCGQVIAWIYMYTHSGLSYSRTFVSSLILIPITVSLVMMVLDNNLVTAFSLMAVFAIVRFRNIVRDTLDTVYILSLIVIGMACGTQRYSIAIVGCAMASLVLLYIWYTNFGSRQRYDYIVNIDWDRSLEEISFLDRLLGRHSLKTVLASQRSSDAEETSHLSYRLLLRDPGRVDQLVSELNSMEGISRVTTMKAEEESEI